jgi:hypothetical protein
MPTPVTTTWTAWINLFSARIHHSRMLQDHRGKAIRETILCQFWALNQNNEGLNAKAVIITLKRIQANLPIVLRDTKLGESLPKLRTRTIVLALSNASIRCSKKHSPWPTLQPKNTNSLSKLNRLIDKEWSTTKVRSNQTRCTSHPMLQSMVLTA